MEGKLEISSAQADLLLDVPLDAFGSRRVGIELAAGGADAPGALSLGAPATRQYKANYHYRRWYYRAPNA